MDLTVSASSFSQVYNKERSNMRSRLTADPMDSKQGQRGASHSVTVRWMTREMAYGVRLRGSGYTQVAVVEIWPGGSLGKFLPFCALSGFP